jgi:Cu(I)/Ag(I) efflux system outer membrane protein
MPILAQRERPFSLHYPDQWSFRKQYGAVSLFTSGSGMWNFIPKIEIPIFNAGRNKANLKLAEIRQQQSVVNYEQKIQSAFKDVSDTLALTALASNLSHSSVILIHFR